jgi:hypothetical protein
MRRGEIWWARLDKKRPVEGYAFPYSWGEGVEITPDRGECFAGDTLCAAATIPADSSSGMGLGWNLNQVEGMDPAGTLVLTAPVRIWLRGALAGMHVGIGLGDVGGDGFCYELGASAAAAANSDAGLLIMLQDFAQRCWDPATAVAYAGSPIRSVFVDYPGNDSTSTNVDVCLVDAGPG